MLFDLRVQLELAQSAFRERQFNLAFSRYKFLADTGQPECQVYIAWMLGEGIGCAKNEVEAARYYELAASLENPTGCFYFGRWLTKSGEHQRALSFYRKAAGADYLPAMVMLGYSLARGKGAAVNLNQAYAMLITASRRGHVYALRELAVQDWRGGRGVLFRALAPFEFLIAAVWGSALTVYNKDSDLLRA